MSTKVSNWSANFATNCSITKLRLSCTLKPIMTPQNSNVTTAPKNSKTNIYFNPFKKKMHRNLDFECKFCKKRYYAEWKLNNHTRVTHGGRTLTYKCDICEKMYIHKQQHLKNHIESSHQYLKFKCPNCNKVFGLRKSLFRHIESVHQGKKHVQCDICKKNYTRKDYLVYHLKIHNKESKQS